MKETARTERVHRLTWALFCPSSSVGCACVWRVFHLRQGPEGDLSVWHHTESLGTTCKVQAAQSELGDGVRGCTQSTKGSYGGPSSLVGSFKERSFSASFLMALQLIQKHRVIDHII